MIYAWGCPERISRSVMIGVNPPGHLLWPDARMVDEVLGHFGEQCAQDAKRLRLYRSDLNAARISWLKSSGSSQAAK